MGFHASRHDAGLPPPPPPPQGSPARSSPLISAILALRSRALCAFSLATSASASFLLSTIFTVATVAPDALPPPPPATSSSTTPPAHETLLARAVPCCCCPASPRSFRGVTAARLGAAA
ncbi:unnamed protein product [Urochloa humidicola]